MKLSYWVLCARDIAPERMYCKDWMDLLSVLTQRVQQRGPLIWMVEAK